MSDEEETLLTPCQVQLLAELSALTQVGPHGDPPAEADETSAGCGDLEALCGHWRRLGARRQRSLGLRGDGRWAWACELRRACTAAGEELDALLGHVAELERQRQEVVGKTALLHEQCRLRTADVDRLTTSAGAITQRLGAFDSIAEVTRFLDEGRAAASPAEFGKVLERIESSSVYMESHYDFHPAKACLHHFDHLRSRSCILVRSTIQRYLEGAEEQVQSWLWEQAEHGCVDTGVFYASFDAAAPSCRPLLALLHRFMDANKAYVATLEELEQFYVNMRSRLIVDATGEHIGAMVGENSKPGQFARTVRQAGSHFVDVLYRERQSFRAFFEVRQPQDALLPLLQQVGGVVYRALRPLVADCSSLDELREMAECLQLDLLEPQERAAVGDELRDSLGAIRRLHADAVERLLVLARAQLRETVGDYRFGAADLDYPALLFRRLERTSAQGHGRGWCPTVEATLGLLAKTYRVFQAPAFEAFAQEATRACLASLRQAAALLARRPLPEPPHELGAAVRAMDARLFLIRHLLVLREQASAFEYDAAAAGVRAGAPGGGVLAAIPGAFWAQGASRLRRAQARRNALVEAELAAACDALLGELAAWISGPVLLLSAQGSGGPSGAAGAGGGGAAERAAEAARAFLDSAKRWTVLAGAHFRAYLGSPGASAPGGPQGGARPAEPEADAGAVLAAPLRRRLLDVWRQLPTGPPASGLPSAAELDAALAALEGEAARLTAAQLAEMVGSLPRAEPAAPAAPPAPVLQPTRGQEAPVEAVAATAAGPAASLGEASEACRG